MKMNDLTHCNIKVTRASDGSSKWKMVGFCKGKMAFKSLRADGSTIACYCKKHAPKNGECGLVIVPMEAAQ